MSTEAKRKKAEERSEREAWQMEDTHTEEVSVPAIRHVGPTLESDPEYLKQIGSGESTPEAQIAAEAATAVPELGSGSEVEAGEPEPLKTRLPGDTSSDPHTDVGPENATTLQRRGERKRNAA